MDLARQVPRSMGILQARILEWLHALLQGIFPNQGLNHGVLHCRRILTVLAPREAHSGGNRLVDTGKRSTISAQEAFPGVGGCVQSLIHWV